MEEEIVTIETASIAKDKAFTVPSRHAYDDVGNLESALEFKGRERFTVEDLENARDNTRREFFLAPTQTLLQKWLRERHNIIVIVVEVGSKPYQLEFAYGISSPGSVTMIGENKGFSGWEEALEVGLQDGLDLI